MVAVMEPNLSTKGYYGVNFNPKRESWSGEALPAKDLPMRGLAVDISHVRKSYGERMVMAELDLSIAQGEFVAIVGRSGCGKTTLLRLIAGLTKPDAGAISIGDKPVDGLNRDVKLLFQEARLLPWQTVLQNVGIARGENWKALAQDVLNRVGLTGREADWPSVLSGGQRQRVALARALVSRPKVLLLDEPFGALDALTRLEMHDLLNESWQREGFTTVLITHDVAEAVALADRVIVLKNGRVTLSLEIDLPRPRRAVGDVTTARLQAKILEHVI
jgi:sulfonate transport system ATP-binding protein